MLKCDLQIPVDCQDDEDTPIPLLVLRLVLELLAIQFVRFLGEADFELNAFGRLFRWFSHWN